MSNDGKTLSSNRNSSDATYRRHFAAFTLLNDQSASGPSALLTVKLTYRLGNTEAWIKTGHLTHWDIPEQRMLDFRKFVLIDRPHRNRLKTCGAIGGPVWPHRV